MTPPVQPVPGQPAPAGPPTITGRDLNARIANGDPTFPRELWGKTLGEAMRYYNVMRQDFMTRNDPARQGQPAQPAGQPAPAPAPAPVTRGYEPPAQPQPSTQPAPGMFTADQVQRMIDESVAKALASSPMAQNAIEATVDRCRAQFPDWPAYEQEIFDAVRGAPPESLTNIEVWKAAYYMTKGKALSTGAQPHQPPAGQPSPIHTPPPQQPYFSESSTAPAPGGNGGGGPSAAMQDPRVIAMARRFGVPVEEYVLWMNGNVPPVPTGGSNGR